MRTTSPRRRRGASPSRTHRMKRAFVIARHFVLSVTQRSCRMAPIIVKLSPQFIGRDSTYSSPRGTHACDRPIAMFAPASSRKTSRLGSTCRTHFRNAARLAWTSGRSISLGRGRFFEHISHPMHRAPEARGCGPLRAADAAVVCPAQLGRGAIRSRPDHRVELREVNGAPPAAAPGVGRDRPGRPHPRHPSLQRAVVEVEQRRHRRI